MQGMRTISIVGGGPAGAMAAETLMRGLASPRGGRNQTRVVVFEEKPGWEKPCGGGLSHKALNAYPFLLPASEQANPVWNMELCAPGGVVAHLKLREPLVVYSRTELNNILLRRCMLAGAEVVRDRITSVGRIGDQWRLSGRAGSYEADYLILAGGARSRLRNSLAGPLKAQDFMLTYGYYVPVHEDLMRIRFFENFEGYAWAFPRKDHLSVGICGKAGQCKMSSLQQKLAQFMEGCGYSKDSAPIFSHLLPSLEADSWKAIRFEGDGWALAGDTAGLADPITGEGLYFALRSGELLAESLVKGFSYTQSLWKEIGARLMLGARICPKFYRGEFLGAGVTTRMIRFCDRSRTFLKIFQDLVEGSQEYQGLRSRVLRSLPNFLVEIAGQSLLNALGVRFPKRMQGNIRRG